MARYTGNSVVELGELLGFYYKGNGYNVTGNGKRDTRTKVRKNIILCCYVETLR